MRRGERFYLLGEDLNVDPETGKRIYPFAVCEPGQFLPRLAALPDAARRTVEAGGDTFKVLEIGYGRFVTAPASVDRSAYAAPINCPAFAQIN